jgi:secreted PhoX family phosphatase
MCTDGEDANQFLAGITPLGQTFPLAHNQMSDEEFAGATFSPDGGTLFVNVQVPAPPSPSGGRGVERVGWPSPSGCGAVW